MFEDVYEHITPEAEAQMKELKRIIEKYPKSTTSRTMRVVSRVWVEPDMPGIVEDHNAKDAQPTSMPAKMLYPWDWTVASARPRSWPTYNR